jgi:hypothetical protein
MKTMLGQTYTVRLDVRFIFVSDNIQVTKTQLWEAKMIILDLLGWGVTPSYLVDCGLTREAVYYVFTELNLKLPSNLNTEGLLPYSEIVQAIHNQNPYDSANVEANSVRPPISTFDIENQKRMELLARKAVLASRKSKTTAASSRQQSIGPQVDTQIVDSFLNSIASASSSVQRNDASASGSTWGELDTDLANNEPVQSIVSSSQTNHEANTQHQPSRPVRRNSRRPVASDFVDVSANNLESLSSSSSPHLNGHSPIGTGFSASGRTTPASLQRSAPTFANVGSLRRCVIDFSEDEDDESPLPRRPASAPIVDTDVEAKAAEIRRLREKIELYRLRKLPQVGGQPLGCGYMVNVSVAAAIRRTTRSIGNSVHLYRHRSRREEGIRGGALQ